MDIYIAYTRIQIFKFDYTFLKNTSVNFVFYWYLFCKFMTKWCLMKVKKVTVFAVIISGIMALPINISRQVMTYEFNLANNSSLVLHTYGKICLKEDYLRCAKCKTHLENLYYPCSARNGSIN
jgi:hypothetical protein